MALPPKPFFTLYDLAARWGCDIADIAGWAALGYLPVVTGIPLAICGSQRVAGIVGVAIADMMQMFHCAGAGESVCHIRRLQLPGDDEEWLYITDPAAGIPVRVCDLMVPADDVLHFEEDQELLRRPSSSIGAAPRYDWDAIYVWLFQRLHEQGFPVTQAELVAEVQNWFGQNTRSGEVPEDSTIRKRLSGIWRAIRSSG